MNRRLLLTSMAVMAASPVLAQNNPGQTPAPANNAPNAQANLSPAREKHIKDTLTVGSLSLMLSRIALPKVNFARLKGVRSKVMQSCCGFL